MEAIQGRVTFVPCPFCFLLVIPSVNAEFAEFPKNVFFNSLE